MGGRRVPEPHARPRCRSDVRLFRFTAIAVAWLLIAAIVPVSRASAGPPDLSPGEVRFWDGEYVAESRGGLPAFEEYFFASPEAQPELDPCVTGLAFCRRYTFGIATGGATLRVALDSSRRGECFALELRDPGGRRVSAFFDPGFPFVCPEEIGSPQMYTLEFAVPEAVAGTWELRVIGAEVTDWAYRLRAVLERPARRRHDFLRPNLIPWLPSEFGFVAPSGANPGTEIDRRNLPGTPGISCHAEEAPDVHCLRFSSGISNVGDGPLFLAFRDDEAIQHIYRADGTPEFYGDNETDGAYLERAAGRAEFHPAHAHRHFQDMVLYELFAVSRRRLTPLGNGHKHGWCAFSQRHERWFDTRQDGQFASFPGGEQDRDCDTAFTLERGWGDQYRWQRPGQYVPYDQAADNDGTMRAGAYVVRVTVDPEKKLKETRENDNVGYALIRVIDGATPHSDRVVVCETGLGASPWDRRKTVVADAFLWAERLRNPNFSPERCWARGPPQR
jgi:hypothetical protein